MPHHTRLALPHHITSLDKHNKKLITLSLLRRHTIPSLCPPFYPSSAASSSSPSSSSYVLASFPFLLLFLFAFSPFVPRHYFFHSVSFCFPILLRLASVNLCTPLSLAPRLITKGSRSAPRRNTTRFHSLNSRRTSYGHHRKVTAPTAQDSHRYSFSSPSSSSFV
ncbi:MAG: hypothetical protein JOS17DRAFT_743081 [Linnemannia elongata]|nr:MAG: hypothetical protein JOS17DRAFT_743081 [Linnemannia elongata]